MKKDNPQLMFDATYLVCRKKVITRTGELATENELNNIGD